MGTREQVISHPPAFITFCEGCGKQMNTHGGYIAPLDKWCYECRRRKCCSCLESGREEDVANCQICKGEGTVKCAS